MRATGGFVLLAFLAVPAWADPIADSRRLRAQSHALVSRRTLDEALGALDDRALRAPADPASGLREAAALLGWAYSASRDERDLESARVRLRIAADIEQASGGCAALLDWARLEAAHALDLGRAFLLGSEASSRPADGCRREGEALGRILAPWRSESRAAGFREAEAGAPEGESVDPAALELGEQPLLAARLDTLITYARRDFGRAVLTLDHPVAFRVAAAAARAGPNPADRAPARLTIELPGVRAAPTIAAVRSFGEGILRRVRVASVAGALRVAFDLDGPVRYRVFPWQEPFRLIVDLGRPSAAVPAATARRPVLRRVVLDPGHGGTDPGALGRTSRLEEKEITLDLARRVSSLLRQRGGIEVVLTRTADRTMSLEERPAIANGAGADLFLSIHVNSSPEAARGGVETYVLDTTSDEHAIRLAARENKMSARQMGDLQRILAGLAASTRRHESEVLAQAIQRTLVGVAGRYGVAEDRGVRRALFSVLFGSAVPAALVEVGFLSNPEEEARLGDDRYRTAVAGAIVDAIVEFAPAPGAPMP